MKVLVTGALGFVGSHLAKSLLSMGYDVVPTARNRHHKHIRRLEDAPKLLSNMIYADLTQSITGICEGIDAVIHCAAHTFVDHSIRDPAPFWRDNVIGTLNLLEDARVNKVKRFIYVSTDEVYGPAPPGYAHKETDPQKPSNPYSASKAACENLAFSYYITYGMEVIITRTENNYGYYQERKVIPVFVKAAIEGKPLPVYGDGLHQRRWLRVEDHCLALELVLRKGEPGQIYNIAGEQELTNLELARKVLDFLNLPERIQFVPDYDIRPGHDRRYAIDASKIKKLGWRPTFSLDEGLRDAVIWYKIHFERGDW